jgi:hypothetical protein
MEYGNGIFIDERKGSGFGCDGGSSGNESLAP